MWSGDTQVDIQVTSWARTKAGELCQKGSPSHKAVRNCLHSHSASFRTFLVHEAKSRDQYAVCSSPWSRLCLIWTGLCQQFCIIKNQLRNWFYPLLSYCSMWPNFFTLVCGGLNQRISGETAENGSKAGSRGNLPQAGVHSKICVDICLAERNRWTPTSDGLRVRTFY